MQRMRPHVAPEPIQPDLPRRRPRPRQLEDALRHAEPRVGRDDLDARDPLGDFGAQAGGQVAAGCVFGRVAEAGVDEGDLVAGVVGQGFGGAEVGEEGAVAGEDGELGGGGRGGVGCVGPGPGVFVGVGCCVVERAEGDADVEV